MSAPIIFTYLQEMQKQKASDLYLTVGRPPTLRCDDEMINISEENLGVDDINAILSAILTSRQRREYESNNELNNALDMGELGRYRINVMRQRQMPALVIRHIESHIPSLSHLNLPEILGEMALKKRGLILLTGMTGSGKSTTLASMIDKRNTKMQGHIVTIEDPIEYFHAHKKSVVTQREVGVDTESYAIAMKNALRQRPDVILVGEVRDREVMEQALVTAETGHLCLSTIHTNNSYQAIERIVNLFPEDYHSQIRLNLSMNLHAIISQRLIPSLKGGLVPAIEVMINEGLIRDLIIKGEISKIKEVIESNRALGMCSFDQSLMDLYVSKQISEETAITNSDMPSDMKVKLKHANLKSKDSRTKSALQSLDTSIISFKD